MGKKRAAAVHGWTGRGRREFIFEGFVTQRRFELWFLSCLLSSRRAYWCVWLWWTVWIAVCLASHYMHCFTVSISYPLFIAFSVLSLCLLSLAFFPFFSRPPMLPLLSLLSPTVSSKLKCPSPPRTPVPLRASLCQSLTPFSTGTAPFLCIRWVALPTLTRVCICVGEMLVCKFSAGEKSCL